MFDIRPFNVVNQRLESSASAHSKNENVKRGEKLRQIGER